MNRRPPLTCGRCDELRDGYLAGDLARDEHAGVRAHLESCPACREALVAEDPLQIFAALSGEARPPEAWDGFWEGIRAGIRAPQRARYTRRQAAAWMAAAAALILIVAAWVLSPGLPVPAPDRAAPPVQTAGLTVPAPPAWPASGSPRPQTVEQVLTPDSRPVQVFSMAYDPGAGEPAGPAPVTELVLIVDAGLEL